MGPLLERHPLRFPGLGHGLDVPAGAERPARAREHHGADCGILGQPGQGLQQAVQHAGGQGVQPVRAVEREHCHTVLDDLQEVLGHGAPPK